MTPQTADLPVIPGGWTEREWIIKDRSFRMILPATPDAFLDDPEVHRAFEHDDYMPYWAFLWPAALKMAGQFCPRSWAARRLRFSNWERESALSGSLGFRWA